ncbi:MAG: S9 family peptidase [Nitriliruptoraceae bacterium]
MRPSDLDHLAVPGDPQLHPDRVRTAYVLSEVDLEEDRYHRTIHVHDGTGTRRFTHGPADSSPRWSPDGRWLAFLRKGREASDKPQLYVMPADGGEARRRTDLPLGVSDLAWAPDSTRLVLVAAIWHADVADLDDEERARRPKRITRLPYRSDTRGWLHDRSTHLHVVDVTGSLDPVRLETGSTDVSSPVWTPDGLAISYVAEPVDWPDTEPHAQVLQVRVPPTEELAELDGPLEVEPAPLTPPGMWSAVHHDAEGRTIVTGLPDPYDWPGTPGHYLLRPSEAGGTALVPLTEHLDADVTPGSPPSSTVGPRFVEGGLLTMLEGRGRQGVVRLELSGLDLDGDATGSGGGAGTAGGGPQAPDGDGGLAPACTEVVGGPRAVTGFSASPDGEVVVFTATDPATPGELYRLEDGRERCLTDLAQGFRAKVDVRPTQRFTFERDGTELDVWAVLPPGFDAAEPGTVPVLLNIHGGPTAQYGDAFFDEFQVEAGAGYLAVGTNPRGSSGRGRDWARAVVGAWGAPDSVDTLDLEAVIDAVCDRYPQADPTRVGVMGGSYGGYATARLLARTDRYASAIVERGLLQWESFAGTSDIGAYFDRMFLGTSLLEGTEVHAAASPVGTAHRITTPTLVLHSEADWRCPIEQGEQLFAALRRARVPSEMVRFPDEGHELSRSGAPKHRVERFEVVLDWHARYLQDG